MSQALSNVFKLKDIINVKDPAFGAKGDGVTDDLAAFNRARDAAGSGRAIYIPPSNNYYRLSAAWTFTGANGILIFGSGENSMLVVDSGASAIRLLDCLGYKIKDLTISGKVGSLHGIEIGGGNNPSTQQSHYGTIENVFIRGVDGNGIELIAGIETQIIRPVIVGANRLLPFTVTGIGQMKKGINIRGNVSGHNNACGVFYPQITGLGTHGVDVNSQGLTGVQQLTIIGGSIQGNGNRTTTGNTDHANLRIKGGSAFNSLGCYYEQNSDVERNIIIDSVNSGEISGGYAGTDNNTRGQVEVIGNSERIRIIGVFGNQFTFGASTKRCTMDNCIYNTNGGSITNSGTDNRILRNLKGNGDLFHNQGRFAVGGDDGPRAFCSIDLRNPSEALQLNRMTTAERNVITTPLEGMVILNQSLGKMQVFASGQWETVTSAP